jgi:hypothetical protein
MAREPNPQDLFEKEIIDNPDHYNVVLFRPLQDSRVGMSFDDLSMAIAYGKAVLDEPNRVRAAMIYAIDKNNHHALVGTINRFDKTFKKVEQRV